MRRPPKATRPAAPGPADLRGRAARWLLLALPPLTALVVGLSWSWASAPSAGVYARLVGGPTEGQGPFTGRVQLLERNGAVDLPLAGAPVTIEAVGGEQVTRWRGRSDENGWAEVRLERPPKSHHLDVRVVAGERERLAAEGRVQLSLAAWRRSSATHAGLVEGRSRGDLQLEVQVARGVLAAPFAGELQVTVTRGGAPTAGAELTWAAEGLEVLTPAPLWTDARGRVRLQVAPRGHVATLELSASGDAGSATWFSTLPVVPGAMSAEVVGAELLVRSPIERSSAWYTWVTPSARLGGGKLNLVADASGALGRVPLPRTVASAAAAGELWVVVSSEADARSPGAVGWPAGEQHSTFYVAEALLLDGAKRLELESAATRGRVNAAVYAFAALATLLTVVLFVGRVLAAGAHLRRREGAQESAEQEEAVHGAWKAREGGWGLVLAAICVALGVSLAALVGLLWTR